jgi:restriction endonuclease S subunit
LTVEANINQAVALIRLIELQEGPNVDYLLHYFNSPSAIEFMLGSRVTTAQPNMSLTDAREFTIPLPPLAEQHRIVAKVDALMALCDRLEASLATAATTRRRCSTPSSPRPWRPPPPAKWRWRNEHRCGGICAERSTREAHAIAT